MRAFGDPPARPGSEAFDAWLRETASLDAIERDRRLTGWATAPSAHLVPLMVIAGAAGGDKGVTAHNGSFMGTRLPAYHFG